ncbi:MAG: hypothetical protein IPM57_07130 [Oligoflexia bacterium]|nr:hypothetical protein [Oligoflexia bacterium]
MSAAVFLFILIASFQNCGIQKLPLKSGNDSSKNAQLETGLTFEFYLSSTNNQPHPQDLGNLKKQVLALKGKTDWVRLHFLTTETVWISDQCTSEQLAQFCVDKPGNLTTYEPNMLMFDEAISFIKSQGFKIILYLNPPSFSNFSFSDYLGAVKKYSELIAQRYGSKIDVYQIFNEANLRNFRTGEAFPAAATHALPSLEANYLNDLSSAIAEAAAGIKKYSPKALITTNAGGWPGAWPGMGESKQTTYNKLDEFFNALPLDFISFDIYGERSGLDDFSLWLKQFKNKYKDVWIMEAGWCSSISGGESLQAEKILDLIGIFSEAGIKRIILYEYQDKIFYPSNDCEATFGLVKADGSLKTSHDTVINNLKSWDQ